jgi:flagellar biogenesis protein FliO
MSCVFPPPKRAGLSQETMPLRPSINRCRRSSQAMFLRSSRFLLVLTIASVSAIGQVQGQSVVPPHQQEWASRTPDRSSAVTVDPKALPLAGHASEPVPRVSQVGYEGFSSTAPVLTQQQADGSSTAATPNSNPAPFIDLTNETLEGTTASTAEPSSIDMLIRLGTWTVIILCLCGLTALAIRRWQTKHGMLPVARGQSQIVETVSLGANRSISLVELRGVQALVGCDANGIQSIVPVPPAFPDLLDSGEAELTLSQSSNAHIKSTA